MKPIEKDERGFTLISVLIAVTILAIGLMALARTQGVLARTQGSTAYRATALAIAQDYVEVLRTRDSTTLVTEPATVVDERGDTSSVGRFKRSTTVTRENRTLRRVTVQVEYPGSQLPIELVTLIFLGAP